METVQSAAAVLALVSIQQRLATGKIEVVEVGGRSFATAENPELSPAPLIAMEPRWPENSRYFAFLLLQECLQNAAALCPTPLYACLQSHDVTVY